MAMIRGTLVALTKQAGGKRLRSRTSILGIVASLGLVGSLTGAQAASEPTYDISTLAGKVASVNGTAGLQIRFSALIEQQADVSDLAETPDPFTPITPSFVLSSGLDGTSVAAPDVTVNLDTAAAP